MGGVALWWIAIAFVIYQYVPVPEMALTDSLVYTVLGFWALMILENIFRISFPQRWFGWLGIVFIIVMALGVLVAGDFLLSYLFDGQTAYLLFLEQSVWTRGLVLVVLFGSFSLVITFNAQLEDQLKVVQREEQIQKMAKDAELFQLRQQLQPHFLFNSLNSINALIHLNPEKAREMVLQLSDFLRGTIRKDDKKWIFITEELEFLQLFLDIERIRFGHRLKVTFELGESAQLLKIPQLLIQPLLENALKHGLNGVVGPINIEMKIKKTDNYLEMSLSNPYDPKGGHMQGAGFGLDAVRRRLYLLFGRTDLFSVSSTDTQYTVLLKIPQLYDQHTNH